MFRQWLLKHGARVFFMSSYLFWELVSLFRSDVFWVIIVLFFYKLSPKHGSEREDYYVVFIPLDDLFDE